ncbi:thioredoxin domain-containing protein [archaeon]|nr:thioredoxin domain-containing protein [archaeon]MBL7056898.1 thioredoxin domain-containing protein [Candidatus Woesearchaeota archaeon]
MICIIALIVFGILGIFSSTHRIIAKEALDCMFKRVTLRKCDTGLDKRLKAQITGKLMKRCPVGGRFIYRHFEIISWIFLILFIISIVYSIQGIYYLALYQNCNGEDATGFCPFNPGGTGSNGISGIADKAELNPGIVGVDDDPWFGNPDAKVTIIEFGCFKCQYSREAALGAVKKLYENNQDEILFVFRDFPLSIHEHAHEPSLSAQCVYEQSREGYWDYYFALFENQEILNDSTIRELVLPLGINMEQYDECVLSQKYDDELNNDYADGHLAGIYGTPTFFINGEESLVGPKSYKEFKKIIDRKLKE